MYELTTYIFNTHIFKDSGLVFQDNHIFLWLPLSLDKPNKVREIRRNTPTAAPTIIPVDGPLAFEIAVLLVCSR